MENIRLKTAQGILTLLGIKGLGPATALKLAGKFETMGQILNSSADDLKGLANEPIRRILTEGGPEVAAAVRRANDEIGRAEEIGATVISAFDDQYPRRLASVSDKPLVLYTSGDLSLLEKSVACVGTRNPTEFGSVVSRKVTSALGEFGWTIVSGLARGVDSICHNAALACDTPTAAVLGSGIDKYASNAAYELVTRIVEAGGIVVTEQPMGREADPSTLIRRNRIQTGVSAATVFMQADLESGTMHSVKYALLQGRPIYAPEVPAAFADEPLNRAASALTRMNPVDFGKLINANAALEEALSRLGRRTVATAITGREFYPIMISQLEDMLERPQPGMAMAG